VRVSGQDAQQGLAFAGFGAGEGEGDGQAAEVATRCSRSPQNQREWLAQYPYSAQPARSERRAVSRERPHSTGVQSTTQTSSVHKLVSAASSRIKVVISTAAARSRRL
jgi:hypothetical protein